MFLGRVVKRQKREELQELTSEKWGKTVESESVEVKWNRQNREVHISFPLHNVDHGLIFNI